MAQGARLGHQTAGEVEHVIGHLRNGFDDLFLFGIHVLAYFPPGFCTDRVLLKARYFAFGDCQRRRRLGDDRRPVRLMRHFP